MNTILSSIKRHPIVTFVTLTYLLSWWSAPFTNGQIMPQGPAVAAVIVLAITAGRSGLRSLWQRITHWRVAWYWYLTGPGIIASYLAGAYVLNLLMGARVTNPPHLPTLGTFFELLLLGGWLEEPGWSGFALPKLQERFANRPHGVLLATLGVGIIRATWHLPLFIYGHIPWFDILVSSFALQIMASWLFNRSGGSALIVMLLHFASNMFAGGIMLQGIFTGAAQTRFYELFVILQGLIALGILLRSGLRPGKDVAQKNQPIADPKAA